MNNPIPILTVFLASIALSLARAEEKAATPSLTSLKGSHAKVVAAHDYAVKKLDLTFAADAAQVERMVAQKLVVPLSGNASFALSSQVSNAYARPAAKLLAERLGAQFRAATGETLVVTSALRPLEGKLWNSSSLTVHPTGMAIDFRVPQTEAGRKWLERTLLTMQTRGLVIATRERRPPHLHVVVLCDRYEAWVAQVARR